MHDASASFPFIEFSKYVIRETPTIKFGIPWMAYSDR